MAGFAVASRFRFGRIGNASAVAEYSMRTGGFFQGLLLYVLIVLGSKLLVSVASVSTSLKREAYLEVLVLAVEALTIR